MEKKGKKNFNPAKSKLRVFEIKKVHRKKSNWRIQLKSKVTKARTDLATTEKALDHSILILTKRRQRPKVFQTLF